ncbi:MAG: tryptophan synthase subunit alpha [Pseudonocardiaceae bacterium]
MSAFFADRHPGDIGLAVFLNAGDPPLDQLEDLVLQLDACRVDCLELAVPFPDSVSDGPVIRRSARRALEGGIDLDATLAFVASVRPRLSHLKIALLADWSHTARALPPREFVGRVQSAGADALLLHGLPPRLRQGYYETAHLLGQPIVSTCYATSADAVLDEAGRHGSAYLYLAAHYGKTGAGPADYGALAPVITALRRRTEIPIAVGFGVRDRSHLAALRDVGADAAIVGSTWVAHIERAVLEHRDLLQDVRVLLADLDRPGP